MTHARILMLLGSGETSPTMVTLHQNVLAHVTGRAVLVDTPYGFQENADELTGRITSYFAQSVGRPIDVVRMRSASDWDDPAFAASQQAILNGADWLFSGPGSPTYALDHWQGTVVPTAMDRLLANGGVVALASAASLTAGAFAVPVYEIYKVGQAPFWREGLDVLGRATGLTAAVVPHYDNAEGGTHDTRFCYLGERRLRLLESELSDGVFVWGLDEHTASVIDLEAGTVAVSGRGGLTIRIGGESRVFPSGATVALEEIRRYVGAGAGPSPSVAAEPDGASATAGDVRDCLSSGDFRAAAAAWARLDAGETDRAELRALVVDIADAAAAGLHAAAPFVDLIVRVREDARAEKRWADSDRLRDALAALGVEIKDSKEGSSWSWR